MVKLLRHRNHWKERNSFWKSFNIGVAINIVFARFDNMIVPIQWNVSSPVGPNLG